MDYKKLEELVKSNKLDIVNFCERIGMSKGGYYAMLEKKTLKVEVLEKIAEVLDVPVSTFFGETVKPHALNEPAQTYGNNDMIAVLKEISKLKDEIITLHKELAATKESQSIQPKKSTPKLAGKE